MKVGLFIPCYIDAFFPEVGVATLELLERLGCSVEYPLEQTCCGQPMANSGCQDDAAATEAVFVHCFQDFDTIVGPSGSCVHHVRFHLDAIEQTPQAQKVRAGTRELVEFLHDDLKVDAFPWAAFPHKVGLHDSCSAIRGLGHTRPSELVNEPYFSKTRDLLGKVKGLELVEIDRPDECCGFGGSFCVTDEAVSAKMGYDRVHDFYRHGVEYIASADMSCLLHMKGVIDRLKLPLKVIHIAQILNGGPFEQESGVRGSGIRGQKSDITGAEIRSHSEGRRAMSRPVDPEARAARFISLEVHESTHDRLVWGMRHNRDKAVAGVPQWEELRDLASQIKEHTLTHLDQYLEQFEANATKRGTHVHWARDAEEHNAVVYEILQAHKVKSLIKSKSMLQEECGMTPYLQKRGIEVTESDLGERIQQLSHEPPSHIVVPAIHKLRTDVAALFAEDIGTDPKDSDPHDLAEAMRLNARPRFLKADAGMTGANFAVAETGGFVVCTNEGNADIGASVPPLHIASIGIEKLIPRARDLGVFIRMLSRSALGSPITQYTSHFHGPRRGGELHVVLVDNTRSERRGAPDFWHALKCIRCGACMNTCPVYRRGGGLSYGATYAGPIGVILDPGFDLSKYRELPFHSSLCGSCTEVCPVKIDISDQIYKWRRVVAAKGLLRLSKRVGMSALGQTLAHPEAFRAAEAVGESALEHLPRFLLYNPLNPWGKHRELPAVPKQTFRQWYLENRRKT